MLYKDLPPTHTDNDPDRAGSRRFPGNRGLRLELLDLLHGSVTITVQYRGELTQPATLQPL